MSHLFRRTAVAALGAVLAATPAFADETLTVGDAAPKLDVEHWVSLGHDKFKPVTKFEDGKVYVVEFWATWCGPCIASMPHLAETQEKYAGKGVQIVSVSDEDLGTVEKFLEREVRGEEGKTYKDLTGAWCLTTDPDESVYKDYMRAAGQNGIPTAFIVGKKGLVEWIGHPMSMDKPLEQVVTDKWDRDAFASEFKKGQEADLARARVIGAWQQGDKEKALKMIDEAVAGNDDADFKTQMMSLKMQMLQMMEGKEKEIAKLVAAQLDGLQDAEPMAVNNATWAVYQMAEQGTIEDKDTIKKALTLTQKAADKAEGDQEKAMILDTVSHLQYQLGDKKAALKTQQQAVKLDDSSEDMTAFLKQLEEEVK